MEGASLNFSSAKLYVKHRNCEEEILKVLEETGHEGRLIDKKRNPLVDGNQSFWYKDRKATMTFVSGVFTFIGLILYFISSNQGISTPFFALGMATGGYYIAKSSFYALKSFSLDMNFLMLIAAIGAAILGEWSEGAAVVFLFSVGNTLQAYTMDKTRRSISQLMELAPNEATLKTTMGEITVPVEELSIGDIVIIKPGEKVPVDGIVMKGRSFVNQASITGESIPIEKSKGEEVFAATLNEKGLLEVKVEKLAEDTTLSKIMTMVEEAQAQKAPSQQFVDRFARYYTPIVVMIAIVIATILPLLLNISFEASIKKALILLVISCPCALVISTPVSIVSAIGNASKQGVLIKGGTYLEEMGQIKAIAFDKTGTLTVGKPVVVDIDTIKKDFEEDPLKIAATMEMGSEHPIGRSVVERAKLEGVNLDLILDDFEAITGKGIKAEVDGNLYYLGNPQLFNEYGIGLKSIEGKVQTYRQEGKTVVILGNEKEVITIFTITDEIRSMSKATIKALKKVGIEKTIMLTGDHDKTAAAVGNAVGITEYKSELLPQDKLSAIEELVQKHKKVAMVGDGINDTPALAAASVGIAMGVAGTDAALETADIALMGDDLNKLTYVVTLSRRALKIITQNIVFSIAIKVLFMILTFIGRTNLWMAIFADTGASIIVILNGMRLLKTKSK
ncbi:MAG: cadmium-translocating P-type ATPase [Clostridiaceae bacterium]|nr:cadmium-translocating P-type ATPase [Clostridiaceae bacterium]